MASMNKGPQTNERTEMTNFKFVSQLDNHTISKYSRDFIRDKLAFCLGHHEACANYAGRSKWLPRRVIDVGLEDQDFVRLVNGSEIAEVSSDAPYVALSHTWGSARVMQLTKETMPLLKSGIQCQQLSRTFQHAIHTTRDLGFRYLWIDSLCIVQDSPDDWSEEASKMQDVYKSTICNIAATGGSDSKAGFAFLRDARNIAPFLVQATWKDISDIADPIMQEKLVPGLYYCMDFDFWRDQVEEAPLNQRAWVLQERILSPRTVHFAQKQVFWQCRQQEACETFPDALPQWSSPATALWSTWTNSTSFRKQLDELKSHGQNIAPPGTRANLYASWDKLLKTYTSCGLTRQEDKFVAISSLVKEMQSVTGDEWLAGFWKTQIIKHFCWRVEWESIYLTGMMAQGERLPISRPSCWRAPSWSWASTNLPVAFHQDTMYNDLSYVSEIKEVEVTTLKSGQIEEGSSLLLRCFLHAGEFSRLEKSDLGRHTVVFRFNHGNYVRAGLCFDEYLDCPVEQLKKVYFAPTQQSFSGELRSRSVFSVVGLLLKSAGEENGVYERIGSFSVAVPSRSDLTFMWVAGHRAETEFEEFDGNRYTIRII